MRAGRFQADEPDFSGAIETLFPFLKTEEHGPGKVLQDIGSLPVGIGALLGSRCLLCFSIVD
jgi:hypothetical protein